MQENDYETRSDFDEEDETEQTKPKRVLSERQRAAWAKCQEGRIRRLQELRADKERKAKETTIIKKQKRAVTRDIRNSYSLDELQAIKKRPIRKATDPTSDEEMESEGGVLPLEVDYQLLASHVMKLIKPKLRVAPRPARPPTRPPPAPQSPLTSPRQHTSPFQQQAPRYTLSFV